MANKIVVAHYQEDVSWLNEVQQEYSPFVVSKGGIESGFDGYALPNIGRESHTFLDYIIKNYDNINSHELIAFVQGNPFDHISKMKLYHDLYAKVPKILGDGHLWCDSLGYPHHPELPIDQVIDALGLVVPDRSNIHFKAGGMFLVNSHKILARPHGFYKDAMKVLMQNELSQINPIKGFVFERLWYYIFWQ